MDGGEIQLKADLDKEKGIVKLMREGVKHFMDGREIQRVPSIAQDIVMLEGLSGTGKTMMGPILSSFARMEVQRIEHIYEYLCCIRYLGRMQDDAAITLLRMYGDLALHNLMIGRESNFRWKDLSGVLRNPGRMRYLTRLLKPDGDCVLDRIVQDNPILHIHSHQLLGVARPLFSAFGERLRIISMVRHPLFFIGNYYPWMELMGKHPREFTICFDFEGNSLPWFALGWEEQYLKSTKMDRTIYVINHLIKMRENGENEHGRKTHQVLTVPFEPFVSDPWPFIREFETFLGTTITRSTKSVMREQKVPRIITVDGKDCSVYRRYNLFPLSSGSTEEAEYKKRWDSVEAEASAEGMMTLEKICSQYEAQYWKNETLAT